ncbi:MAG: type I pantothenate kinase [Pseudomonadota bacterium]
MDQRLPQEVSPFRNFSRGEWSKLRADAPMTLTAEEVENLRSLNDRLSIKEVEEIYLPLSRLLWMYVSAAQQLFSVTSRFLGAEGQKVPYIIGIAGSVAVGKSTTARVLQALLKRWPTTPKVGLITTDGFLHPNSVLETQGLMEKKGFPQSYNISELLRFLTDIKAGKAQVSAPVYSHLIYDIVPDDMQVIDRPDILILEGLNVLQVGQAPSGGQAIPYVSDFFDFSIFIDAQETLLRKWYLERFLALRETAFKDPSSFFHRFAVMPQEEVVKLSEHLWATINGVNLRENILPTRQRAGLILTKGADHFVESVALRRL